LAWPTLSLFPFHPLSLGHPNGALSLKKPVQKYTLISISIMLAVAASNSSTGSNNNNDHANTARQQ